MYLIERKKKKGFKKNSQIIYYLGMQSTKKRDSVSNTKFYCTYV